MKKVFRIVLLFLIPVDLFIIFLVFISVTDFKPTEMENIPVPKTLHDTLVVPDTISMMSWNIGYGGLGQSMDFFYDGGNKVRASKEDAEKWLGNILRFLQSKSETDFFLLQEIDFKAKRTYKRDQAKILADNLSEHIAVKVTNYDVPFVPVPLRSPMGSVKAGMMTFSKYAPTAAVRIAYPQISGWPDKLFLLDRCFIETRYSLENSRELVVLNTHNSAFVNNQKLMQQELDVIRNKMLTEYQAGNYVVAGGDWNMNPPGFGPSAGFAGHRFVASTVVIPDDFLPAEWHFAVDNRVPTNRHLDQGYIKGETGSTILDFFILSPNVQLLNVETIDLGFESSDHNPVQIHFSLKNS
jgi:endonuclease/exonuclease/phosphatase family metal-dependent hydrolase